jgi:Ran GTPase-activating protein (RanGAP) involved in mRNA processing and transport
MMAARRTQRADEATLLDLLMKGDYAGFAKLTGSTVDEIERALDGWRDRYDALDDNEADDWFFGEEEDEQEDEEDEEDEEDGDAFA